MPDNETDSPPPPGNHEAESSTTEPTVCRKCGADAVLTNDGFCGGCDWYLRRDAAIREKANRETAAAWADLVDSIGGEAELPKYTLETFKPFDVRTKSALEAAQSFHPSTGNLYLTGVPGCGKTHLAVALAQKFFAEGKSIRYFRSGPAFARHFMMRDPDEEERRINAVAKVDLLVINELWIGKDTEFRLEKIHEVLDARDMLGRRGMIVTTNIHPADLEERTKDSRLRSRFEGKFRIIMAGEQDYRRIARG